MNRPKFHKDLPTSPRDRFIEAASELGCNDDEAAFKAKVGQIARQKPKDEAATKKSLGNPS